MRAILLPALLLLPSLAAPLRAQGEEREVMAVVQQLFDGMRARDTAKMRATLHPEARLVSAGTRDGAPAIQVEAAAAWVAGVARARPGAVLDERISNPVVHVDAGLASVWVKYQFYLDDKLSHC